MNEAFHLVRWKASFTGIVILYTCVQRGTRNEHCLHGWEEYAGRTKTFILNDNDKQ